MPSSAKKNRSPITDIQFEIDGKPIRFDSAGDPFVERSVANQNPVKRTAVATFDINKSKTNQKGIPINDGPRKNRHVDF